MPSPAAEGFLEKCAQSPAARGVQRQLLDEEVWSAVPSPALEGVCVQALGQELGMAKWGDSP